VLTTAVVCVYAQDGSPSTAEDADSQTQNNQTEANRAAPTTRAGQIELQREQKSSQLQPDSPGRVEQGFNWVKNKKIIDLISTGVNGFLIRFGGLITGSGLAVGPEYHLREIGPQRLSFRASARGSLTKFYILESEFAAPHLADDHVFFDLYGGHTRYPHIDYYGPGPNSKKTGRTDFLEEDTSARTDVGVRPLGGLRLGATGEYLFVNISRGRDERYASTDRVFTEQTTPGLFYQSDFLKGGGYIQYDWRDYPGEPRRGGNYRAEYSSYSDVKRGRYSFSRVDLEGQQYFSFFNQRRVFALRGRLEGTSPHRGDEVPFYLQPSLGGSENLRGFRPFRFHDNNALLMNAEYRWEAFSGLDMALFADAGRVFHDWHEINVNQLEKDFGFGFRFNVRNSVFMRIDTGFSREGFQVWLKFGNVF
jgi:hypothetical protein